MIPDSWLLCPATRLDNDAIRVRTFSTLTDAALIDSSTVPVHILVSLRCPGEKALETKLERPLNGGDCLGQKV